MNKVVILVLISLFSISIYGIDLGAEIGHSSFRYAEVGDNSKDDLYTLDSITLGLDISRFIKLLNIEGSLAAQLPYDFTFEDAMGVDETNYLNDFYYFGLNSQLSLKKQIVYSHYISLSVVVLINYDFFYFRDLIIGSHKEYFYSILGSGAGLSMEFPLNDNASFRINSSYIFNFLPLYDRGTEFLWSDNIFISGSVIWKIGR